MEGVERANSVTVDGHKWLNVPYDCGFAFVRDRALLGRTFAYSEAYLPNPDDPRPNMGTIGPESSRRARALAVWATLKAYGRTGYREDRVALRPAIVNWHTQKVDPAILLTNGQPWQGRIAMNQLVNAASLRRSSFAWTQAEREFGFAHWDTIFGCRTVQRGPLVRELPQGVPIAALQTGTPGAQELDRFVADQKVSGLIVLHDGSVRLERYALGHTATGRWTSQSVAKSVASTLVGAAVNDGFITSIDESVTKYIPGLQGSAYDSVTIRHLLTMTSGVRWNEDYTDPGSDLARFYSEPVEPGLNATVSFMRRLPREAPPGSKWVYKTGETHLLGVLVSFATRESLAAYLSAKIWAPYGMEQAATWGLDRTEHELAGCCLQAGLRDFARFGQFVLDGGVIDGRPVVPDGWFAEATRTQARTTYPDRGYGYQWWTGERGTFAAIGIHGQLIYIDPARRLVVAMNSAWPVATAPERSAARLRFLSMISAAVDGGR